MQNGHQLSLTEGDTLKLACSVLGGMPQPVITWRAIDSHGRTITLKRSDMAGSNASHDQALATIDDAGSETTSLVFSKKLTRDFLNAKIECHVEHEAITNNSLDSHVVVDVNGECCCLYF